MGQPDEMEFSKLSRLVKQFGWEIVKTEITEGNIVAIIKAPRPNGSQPTPEQAGVGGSTGD